MKSHADGAGPAAGRRRDRRAGRRLVGRALLVGLLLTALAAWAAAGTWPGWRGTDRQGRSEAPAGPVHWSPTQNIAWKCPIPGEGRSSPVVSADAVFLTTAFPAARDVRQKWALNVALQVSAALLALWAAAFLVRAWKAGPRRIGLALFVLATLAVVGLLPVRAMLADYDPLGMRRWGLSSLVASACLLLGALYATPGSRLKGWLAAASAAMAAMVAAVVPPLPPGADADSLGRRPIVMLAVAAMPLAVGVLLALGQWRQSRRRAQGGGAAGRVRTADVAAILGTLAAAAAMMGVLRWLIGRADGLLSRLPALTAQWTLVAVLATAGGVLLAVLTALDLSRLGGKARASLPGAFRAAALVLAIVTLVWMNRSTAMDEFARAVVCVDRQTGAVRWVREVLRAPRGRMNEGNSPATPTVAIGGDRVYAYFGSAGLVCLDGRGETLWTSTEVGCDSMYGPAASPVLCDGRVIIASDGTRTGYVAAVDAATGRLAWKTPRQLIPHRSECSRTPLVREVGGRKVILVWGREDLAAYDPADGRAVWAIALPHPGGDAVGGLASDDTHLYLSGRDAVMALDLGRLQGAGEAAWRQEVPAANVSSPLVVDGLLFLVTDTGGVRCMDCGDGSTVWRARLPGMYYASPVEIGGRVYFPSLAGRTTVLAAGREQQEVAVNDLGEPIYASFAPVDGDLFVRTEGHVYCIREP